ncbi:alkaline phosphatase family protein [Bacillus cereus group sp. BfR-BA-01347]|uniref:alkaline phosphatase family protein n=1 Tax=Bacillus cereus group sp. BfR-BA-01347 TaxID=2920310 RepID=UPI001F5AA614|nr:alkaline phosphatase family protein [Bacillus cereus group sp. BfR-BA-01347]
MVIHIKKRVIMLIVDSLMDSPLQEAIKKEKAPALRFFMERGKYVPNVISAFPTMSVNIDSTLLTGTYANVHKIPGLVWFNSKEKRLINYGSHVRELLKLGLIKSIKDIIYHLNNNHLSKEVKTIHEELAKNGKSSASINALIYRGNTEHRLKLPKLLTFFTSLDNYQKTNGANLFTYGALSKLSPWNRYNHFWQAYGFNDKFSAQELKYLIQTDSLPDFTIVYFPDLDKSVHKNGPLDIKGVEKVDRQLQKVLNTYESWDEALKDNIWIVMGDSGQAPIDADRKKALIDLKQLLSSYRIMKLKEGVKDKEQIVLGVNERMAYIYSLNLGSLPLSEITKTLQKDDRIDVIAWKEKESVYVISPAYGEKLSFKPTGEYIDKYEQSWSLTGNTDILNIVLQDNKILYNNYPDALARLYSALTSHEGNYIVVSAKPGFEFIGEGSPTHVGGASHGGLHKQDSLVSMIVTGSDSYPKHLRIVDLKDWILSLIN